MITIFEPKVGFAGGEEFNNALIGKQFVIGDRNLAETVTLVGGIVIEFANSTLLKEVFETSDGRLFTLEDGIRMYDKDHSGLRKQAKDNAKTKATNARG